MVSCRVAFLQYLIVNNNKISAKFLSTSPHARLRLKYCVKTQILKKTANHHPQRNVRISKCDKFAVLPQL